MLQTESTSQGANLNTSEVTELPLGGQRVFTYLARLSPGVLAAESGARDAHDGGFSANGVRSTGENNFLLNGVDNNVNVIDFINQTSYVIGPSVDAIGEMRILTNGYNAEYGRAAGGVVDVNLKSGTNQLHGALFEFLQNTDLDANRWENNLAGVERPPVQQNQFGATRGRTDHQEQAVHLRRLSGHANRDGGGVIQNLGYGGFYTIPTPGDGAGQLLRLARKVDWRRIRYGHEFCRTRFSIPTPPLASAAHAHARRSRITQIPTSLMDPAAAKIASLYPRPNQPFANGNYPAERLLRGDRRRLANRSGRRARGL